HHADTVRGAVGGNPTYVGIQAPTTLEHRYLLEDVPTGLIPLLELGAAAGLALPMLTALVDRCRVVLGGEPWPRQRTLDALGLEGLSPVAIRAVVDGGSRSRRPVGQAFQPDGSAERVRLESLTYGSRSVRA